MGPPQGVTVAFPYKGMGYLQASVLPKPSKTGTSCTLPPPSPPAAISDHCVAYAQGAPDRTQMEADLGLYHLGNPRACTPSGQLQTTLEHHPITSTSHGGRWLLARGQPVLQLSGLGKSLPLTYLWQSRLIYKRREYSAHTEGTP